MQEFPNKYKSKNLPKYSLVISMRNSKSPITKSSHIVHPLNLSKSKTVFSFEKSERFPRLNSHSPNKFYNIPSSLKKTAFSITKGVRHKPQKSDFVPPTKYTIASEFTTSRHGRTFSDTFGISRESYYKPQNPKIFLGPGSYNISRELSSKRFYIGQKLNHPEDLHHVKSQLNITGQSLNKLSTYKKQVAGVRLKTDYFPKSKFFEYDNKVPGPGAYNQQTNDHTPRKSTLTTFGAAQRLKMTKPSPLGPGKYDVFSEFGPLE